MKIKQKYKNIVVKLKSYIRKLKLEGLKGTNLELAELFKVSPTMIGKWLNGEKPMSPKNCIILAKKINEKPEVILITMLKNNEKDIEAKKELEEILKRIKAFN